MTFFLRNALSHAAALSSLKSAFVPWHYHRNAVSIATSKKGKSAWLLPILMPKAPE
ncbi:hypothetical protein GCWU000341_02084 [Oribacterium sp. oral taxon 078 str. F0262]|nr:hypothetical protein GCWU000341_02084 [Oribacterium sp. oral taxon 078 str. F0262]